MRYIGNKTKLLPFIGDALNHLEIDGRTACDPFAGTTAVARFLKRTGYGVACGDILSFSYALQRAYVVLDRRPAFAGLDGGITKAEDPLKATITHLNALPPRPDFVHEHFAPSPKRSTTRTSHDDEVDRLSAGRRYFTSDNAARIDAVRGQIEDWRRTERITEDEFFVLLAALLEAADRVANTTGVYAAYVKSWQPNARRRLRLRIPHLITGTGRTSDAFQGEAIDRVRGLPPFDLLYLDPPYNTRQYAGYYHIPEIIAEGWFDRRPALRGKTGLPTSDGHKRSDWSRRRECEAAFRALLDAADARHILLSYNSEGIIPETTIEEAFRARGDPDTYRRLDRDYKRYRSDSDGPDRRYRGDRVTERLYYVRAR